MFDIQGDYLIAESVLTQLLEGSGAFKKVYSVNELSDIDERSQITPSAHVLYVGDTIPENAQGGTSSQVKQTWLVVLACRLSIHERQAGELIAETLAAISGKSLKLDKQRGLVGPFLRQNSPVKPSFTSSHSYYPLAFTVQCRFNPNLLSK
ncbi:phage tail terminator protein [Shewanella woodyi]|uniref:phage tail terminator protein n=1 Tax=Shewanella woodyi TaxID=60961 RepID=UPI0007F9481D|nr:hypothetical protein [Shewanella woodyi]